MAGAARRRPRAQGKGRWSAIERDLRRGGGPLIAGVDEVGRGSLAGPVVACAVVMPPDAPALRGVDDSKRLTPAQRARLAVRIRERAVALSLGAASVREIDRVNIYNATVLAMRRALRRLRVPPDHVLIDGKPFRTLGIPHTAVVGGDGRCFSIACASIVAKVTRDRLMQALAGRHPGYLWERNVGYGTARHWAALESIGPGPHHRRSFIGPSQLSLDLDAALASESEGAVAETVVDTLLADTLADALPGLAPAAEPESPAPDTGSETLGE